MRRKASRNRRDAEATIEQPVKGKKEKIVQLFDIPAAALPGQCQIELSGNQEAVVDGCQGVLEYDENVIKLACGKMSVKFTGRSLQIRVLTHDSAIVGGFITNIEFIT